MEQSTLQPLQTDKETKVTMVQYMKQDDNVLLPKLTASGYKWLHIKEAMIRSRLGVKS